MTNSRWRQKLWLKRVLNLARTISEWRCFWPRCELIGSQSSINWLLRCFFLWLLWFQSLKNTPPMKQLWKYSLFYKVHFSMSCPCSGKDIWRFAPSMFGVIFSSQFDFIPFPIILGCINFGCLQMANFQHLAECWASWMFLPESWVESTGISKMHAAQR